MLRNTDELPFVADDAGDATPIFAVAERDWDQWSGSAEPALSRFACTQGFKAQAGRVLASQQPDGGAGPILFGLGNGETPLLFGALPVHLPPGAYRVAHSPQEFSTHLLAIAWGLGGYAFDRYRPRKLPAPRLVWPRDVDAEEVSRIVAAAWLVRDLVNTPAQDMSPSRLHAIAEDVARESGATLEAIVGDDLLNQGYGLIHAVGRGAHEAPRLVHLSWGDRGAPVVALVGKGVSFDSGGLGMKTADGMRIMKKDMGGAAHALALGRLAMQAGLPIRLEIFLPLVENAVSANSFHPGDIVQSRKGLTVEVDHTDAEGRLILADAITRACEEHPELLLNFATLTGSARVALGPDVPPMFTDDEDLARDLLTASRETNDPLWRLPIWAPYDSEMDSPIADLKNTGDGTMAGPIYGALFLKRFVDAPSWAHFDLYAWAPKAKPSRPAGGEAQTLRACWHLLRRRYG